MEFTKAEMNAIHETVIDKEVIVELSELELLVVGGGTGDVQLG